MDIETKLNGKMKQLALSVIAEFNDLPPSKAGSVIARQVLRSATSVGANYRSACRARSRNEMISKMNIALEEADETLYWFELASESGIASLTTIHDLTTDCEEIVRMLVASLRTLKGLNERSTSDEERTLNSEIETLNLA